jgi:NAD(P)-dependent dehydrogenase (short-subunit alcohol dehydrogenase family)
MDRLGQVDVLVNNAGACIHRPALGVTAEEWRFVMDVNVNGVWNCAQEFVGRWSLNTVERSSTSARSLRRSSIDRSGSRRTTLGRRRFTS